MTAAKAGPAGERASCRESHAALRSIDELTPQLMTSLLSSGGAAVEVEQVLVRSTSKGATDRVYVTVAYANDELTLPANLFIKTQLDTRVDLGESFAESFANPEMTEWMRAESRFYSQLAPGLGIELPKIYATGYAKAPTHFILVEEDLTDRDAWFPDPASALSVDDAQALVGVLAKVHAPFWDSPRLHAGGDLDWMETPVGGVFHSFIKSESFANGIVAKELSLPYKAEMLALAGFDVESFWRAVWRLQDVMNTSPVTLVHGDAHIGNTYRLPDGSFGLVDWQLVRRASWAHDLSYTVVSSLSVDDRQAHEKDILRVYLSDLEALGVAAPTWDDAWRLWSIAPVWGLLMWVGTPYQMYTQEKVDNTLFRFASACADLGSALKLAEQP